MVALLMVTIGCVIPAQEMHGGASPKPAPPEVIWWGSATVMDNGLQLAKVRAPYRIPIMAVTAVTLRELCAGPHCRYFGRTADSGFIFGITTGLNELLNCMMRGVTKSSWFGCH